MTNTDQSFEKLKNALIDAGRLIDYPATPSFVPLVDKRPGVPKPSRMTQLGLAFTILILFALVAIPETRSALSQAFGFEPASPLTTPMLSITAPPNPITSMTLTTVPTRQTPTVQPTFAGTPSTFSNPMDIQKIIKPIARPIEFNQAK